MRLVFGSPAAINGVFRGDWAWMADPTQAGVGAFGDLGTHKLDLLLFLIGETARLEAVDRRVLPPHRALPAG